MINEWFIVHRVAAGGNNQCVFMREREREKDKQREGIERDKVKGIVSDLTGHHEPDNMVEEASIPI